MNDGQITFASPTAIELGFTPDKFGLGSYLWKVGDSIIISFIESRQRGNFRALVQRIHALGYTVKVPTPLGRMQAIVRKNGYRKTLEPFSEEMPELCEVWSLPPPRP